MNDLKDKKVLVVGLGKSGVAAARYCSEQGAIVTATDIKSRSELEGAIDALRDWPITFSLSHHDPGIFDSADMVVISPGVPSDLDGLSAAAKRGVPVVGEMELVLNSINRPIVAVTGTNGKTTTTALLGHLLKGSGIRVCVAGNIGTPLLDVLGEARLADVVVLEISSFQIESTPSLKPRIAVWLNVTPDHLDRHASFDAYVRCKARLLEQVASDGWGIYNAADTTVSHSLGRVICRLAPFDATGGVLERGTNSPSAWFDDGNLCISSDGLTLNRYQLSRVGLGGIHNRENMLAALIAAELCGAAPADLKRALESFKGLRHRIELVGEQGGVRYYNDSKGTNVGATIRAIESFDGPVILIAGGLSKGADFTSLGAILRERVKRLILIGQAADEMERLFSGFTTTVRARSMDEAVHTAAKAAASGDVVLLSPACASFDMFRDYADRGDKFVDAVLKLVAAR